MSNDSAAAETPAAHAATTNYPPRASLIAYHGGGYDGCIWEWNFCLIDESRRFHNIASTGAMGVETLDELYTAWRGWRADAARGRPRCEVFALHDPAAMSQFTATHSISAVVGVGRWLAENGWPGKVQPSCDQCGCLIDLEDRDDPARLAGISPAGGVVYVPSSLVCGGCWEKGYCGGCRQYDDEPDRLVGGRCQYCREDENEIQDGDTHDGLP